MMIKRLIIISILMIMYLYAFGASIWSDRIVLGNLMTDDDRAKGAIVPVQELYDYLVEKNALIKSEPIDMTVAERAAIPDEQTSPNKLFSIGHKDGNILPLINTATNTVYSLLLPDKSTDITNTVFTPDSSLVIVAMSRLPTGFVCGYSTSYDSVYDKAWDKKLEDKRFLPALFQIKRDVLSAWLQNNEVVIWAGDGTLLTYDRAPILRLFYYSLPVLQELYIIFSNAAIVPFLKEIQEARSNKNTITLKPGQLEIFNKLPPEIQRTLKPFMP